MKTLPDLPNIRLKGPFWTANAEVIRLADPKTHFGFRTLFVEANPHTVLGQAETLLPGTLLALCFVTEVTLAPSQDTALRYTWKRVSATKPDGSILPAALKATLDSGQVALLLLEADPEVFPQQAGERLPMFTCLGGDISLDVLQPQGTAIASLYRALGLQSATPTLRTGVARLPGAISVHASGLSLYGEVTLPWEQASLSAVFQLARLQPDPEDPSGAETRVPGLRLTIEGDRLTDSERQAILGAWQRFNRIVNPKNPLNRIVSPPPTPTWATLELANPLSIPRLYWEIVPWRERPNVLPLHFAGDEFTVLLSDQQPYNRVHSPTSFARIVPNTVVLSPAAEGLQLDLTTPPPISPSTRSFRYRATWAASLWQETVTLDATTVAFDSVQTARSLRTLQALPTPVWSPTIVPPKTSPEPLKDPLLWGFLPLADGWAQLPIPNLTEQIYLDAQIANLPPASTSPSLIQGAVRFGNDPPDVLRAFPQEQPWSLTLTSAQRMTARWSLAADGSTYRVDEVAIALADPDLFLNGLFWLGTEPPTAADALPSLDNWVAGLETIPLKTVSGTELFPPLMQFDLDALTLQLRSLSAATPDLPASAVLGAWSFEYRVNAALFQRLVDKVLPKNSFSVHLPLVWRRHLRLPMVQALPLTQTLEPPNYPSPSRQLVPFELATATVDGHSVPAQWQFGVEAENGAATWVKLLSPAIAATEWRIAADLPLAALSLPGLVLDPNPESTLLSAEPATGLPAQYRFDLPYIDEVQALAQLPKIPRNPNEVSPLPDVRPQPPQPLRRADFASHWQKLSERASLGSADAVAAFAQSGGQMIIQALLDPENWTVRADLSLDAYPGELTIDNADPVQSAPLTLRGDIALKGISGRFLDGGNLRRLPDSTPRNPAQLTITAGTLAAYRHADGSFRDQRGLVRAATAAQTNLLRSPVTLTPLAPFELTTARVPFELTTEAGDRWQFWFRDLPAQTNTFKRLSTRSEKSQDANDPEALGRDFNYLEGYEWRLRSPDNSAQPFLPLFHLHFYPLTLEKVEFEADGVQQIEVIGRLQLPLKGDQEQTDLSNAVRLTFSGTGTALELTAVAVVPEKESPLTRGIVEWPFALRSGEASDAPRLRWQQIDLSGDRNTLTIDDVRLHFFLFGVEWAVPLSPLNFQHDGSGVEQTHLFPQVTPTAVPLAPVQLDLKLDLHTSVHAVNLRLGLRLGNRLVSDALQALYTFTEGGGNTITDRSGVGTPLNLTISKPAAVTWSAEGLTVTAPTLINSTEPGTKLIEAGLASNEIAIEAWVKPDRRNLDNRKPKRIVSLSTNLSNRNFALQQGSFDSPTPPPTFYHVRLRTTNTDAEGQPAIANPLNTVTNTLTHVVYTRTAAGEARIYLNGVLQTSGTVAGTFANWDPTSRLALANEVTGGRPWLGTFCLVALYSRALTAAEVAQRFAAGPNITPLQQRQALTALVTVNLMAEGDRFTWASGRLFDDLSLATNRSDGTPAMLVTETTLQLAWNRYTPVDNGTLHLLPGMALASPGALGIGTDMAPGFVALSFRAVPSAIGIPDLPLTSAFVEALLLCRWGSFLQDADPTVPQTPDCLFGSSAGDLALGYTARWQSGVWTETFLLNGMVEVKNLFSYPYPLAYNADRARLTLPAARSADPPPLRHLRHTLRVLFNQHTLPPELFIMGTGGTLLFTFAPGKSWQLLAVVEHQLVQVDPAADLSSAQLMNEVRWTVVQEVRLLLPRTFQQFLQSLDGTKAINPTAGIDDLGNICGSYLGTGLRTRLTQSNGELERLPDATLLVEASAHHLVKLEVIADATATTLQFLPTGSQGAVISTPQDYAPSDPQAPQWLLLTLPSLGRLQDTALDGLTPPTDTTPLNPLQVDPLLAIHRQRIASPAQPLNDLALTLANWADDASLNITVSSVDTAIGRSFARLDPLSLEESWFRVYNPRLEPQEEQLQSILAALPDTPARLSRPIALRHAVDPRVSFYPPKDDAAPLLPEPLLTEELIWREGSLLLVQGVSDRPLTQSLQSGQGRGGISLVQGGRGTSLVQGVSDHPLTQLPPYSNFLTATLIASSALIPPSSIDVPAVRLRYAAATLIPAPLKVAWSDNDVRPLSLTVSPYLGLEWRPAPPMAALQLRLVLAELLCLNSATSQLRPVASHLWEVKADQPDQTAAVIFAKSQDWARQTQRLLAPESAIVILRYRQINDNTNPDSPQEAALTTSYSFALVSAIAPVTGLAQRLFRIRSFLKQVRFREGQYNLNPIPQSLHNFELAPPQTTGVQPIFQMQRPGTFAVQSPPNWRLSALRVSVRYTESKAGVIGEASVADGTAPTLWWQAAQHGVQYRSALRSSLPTGGLPDQFCAPAIQSMLPVLPDLPLPALTPTLFTEPPLPQPAKFQPAIAPIPHLERWQPVLPGALRYLITGARPGVMLAIRNQLLRQNGAVFGSTTKGTGLTSGSVPVQHRVPRPVPLPANVKDQPNRALQTWASFFQPTESCLATPTPADEAFRAALDDRPAQRLQMILVNPLQGAIDPQGDLSLNFQVQSEDPGVVTWAIALEIVEGSKTFAYALTGAPPNNVPGLYEFKPTDPNALMQFLSSKPAGAVVLVRAQVIPQGAIDGYRQALTFPLRIVPQQRLRLPLEPRFIHFEDPEYNRRLATPTAYGSALVKLTTTDPGKVLQRTVTLAAERRECNPNSTLAIRYDWDFNLPPEATPVDTVLKLERIDISRTPQPLQWLPAPPPIVPPTQGLSASTLFMLSLLDLQRSSGVTLGLGDLLQLTLQVLKRGTTEMIQSVSLAITIVEAPVIPATEAAYALLRLQEIKDRGTAESQVECVRFAWGAAANRIELINPDDLKTEVVRRRAVFHLTDSVRPGTLKGYAIQKITATGSTHFFDRLPFNR